MPAVRPKTGQAVKTGDLSVGSGVVLIAFADRHVYFSPDPPDQSRHCRHCDLHEKKPYEVAETHEEPCPKTKV